MPVWTGITDANGITLQFSNNGTAIGGVIFKKESVQTVPPDLSKFYQQKFESIFSIMK